MSWICHCWKGRGVRGGELRVNGARRTVYQLEDLRGPLKPVRDHWMEEVLIQYLLWKKHSPSVWNYTYFSISAGIVMNLNNYHGDHNYYYFYCFLDMIYYNYVLSMHSFFFFFCSNSLVKKVGAYHVNILLLLFFFHKFRILL